MIASQKGRYGGKARPKIGGDNNGNQQISKVGSRFQILEDQVNVDVENDDPNLANENCNLDVGIPRFLFLKYPILKVMFPLCLTLVIQVRKKHIENIIPSPIYPTVVFYNLNK